MGEHIQVFFELRKTWSRDEDAANERLGDPDRLTEKRMDERGEVGPDPYMLTRVGEDDRLNEVVDDVKLEVEEAKLDENGEVVDDHPDSGDAEQNLPDGDMDLRTGPLDFVLDEVVVAMKEILIAC